ncbi:hypothetical protein IGB42_01655 [Andreprevotia sp. IGB-42]|uniref:DUF1631 family protein n=1 Tax=Andreprevotia sp. IGB-42 TaxID=2497473 RepID=UPI00135A2968|nr:DUF1631 family protein [Andreprevotia sp. IGB-42]KAF0813976.1 hypothetical protein IGB42_01655 [Andreprevotia sp. IGB-42]
MDRNDLLAATRSEFLRAFAADLDGLADRAAASLFERADHASSMLEQRKLLDARTILLTHTQSLNAQVFDTMERLLNRSFQTAYSTFRPSFSDSFSGNSLSLIDVNTVEGELRLDAATARFRNVAEEALRDLNIRVALLFEQDNIKERENPFRPYLFSRCMVSVAEGLSDSPEVITALTEHFSLAMLNRVAGIYERLNALLAKHGIAAELQLKIRKTPGAGGAASSADAGDIPSGDSVDASTADSGPAGVGAAPADSADPQVSAALLAQLGEMLNAQTRLDALFQQVQHPGGAVAAQLGRVDAGTVEQLVQAMHAGGAAAAAAASAPPRTSWLGGAQSVGEVLRGLFSGRHQPAIPTGPLQAHSQLVDVLDVKLLQARSFQPDLIADPDGALRNLIIEQRPVLSQVASDSNEQMIIDIVGMLFEFILRDNQVPAEVRAQLGRLQFSVLKIALLDPALFSHKNHPARMLVNRIGSISAGLQKVDPSGERVVTEIRRIIETLLAEPNDDVSLFTAMLDQLDAFIAHELRAADARVSQAAQAVENSENRTLQYARTTAMVADGLAGLTLEPYLRDFLVKTWPLAIEQAGRTDARRAQSYRLAIPDLIWSIAPKVDPAERKQLFALIPSLLPTLQEGLTLIGWTPAQRQDFVHWLVEAHKDALRVSEIPAPVPPLSLMHERFAPVFAREEAGPAPMSEGGTYVDPRFLDEAIRELEVDLQVFDRVVAQELGDEEPASMVQNEDADVLATLQSGVSIEVNIAGKPAVARLNWVNQDASTMILTMGEDRQPMVIAAKVLRRLLASGRAKFLESAPLFERAIESLLVSADRVA